MKLLVNNNDCIKKLLIFITKNDNTEKIDDELFLLRKKAESLLNCDNQIFLNYDINYFFELYDKVCKLYFKNNEFTINERNKNNKKDILQNSKFLDNYNNIIENYVSNDNNKNNVINNNTFISNDNCLNVTDLKNVKNDIKENTENKRKSLELNEIIKEVNNFNEKPKEVKNRKSVKRKRIKFKVNKKIRRYKGISRNKKRWQVYLMINKKNTYLGSYKSKKMAAKVYDLMCIKKNGINAKTNFKYSKRFMNKIFKMNNINDNNIFQKIFKKSK